jgi:hypothetical protein
VRRLYRILLNALTLLSVLLFVVIVALYVRSNTQIDAIIGRVRSSRIEVSSRDGQIIVAIMRPWQHPVPTQYVREGIGPPASTFPAWGRLGIGWDAVVDRNLMGFEYARG